MPVVWIDPYITGAAANSDTSALCAGTNTSTYNTTRNGTYANPFKWNDFQNNSSSATSVNGVTLQSNTEVRIKGKTMSEYTASIGSWYLSGNEMYPASGNTVWANTIASTSYSSRYLYLSGSNIDAMYPSVSGILKMPLVLRSGTAFNKNGSTASNTVRGEYGALNVVMEAAARAGYSGSSASPSTFCDIAVFKNSYFHEEDITNQDKYHWFNMNGRIIKVSAGWTSETEQGGYSFVTLRQNDFGEYVQFKGTSVHFDCGRLGLFERYRYFRGVQLYADRPSVAHQWGSFNFYEDSNLYTSTSYQNGQMTADGSNSSLEVGLVTGYAWGAGSANQTATCQVNLTITDRWFFRAVGGNFTGRTTKIGSIYCDGGENGFVTTQAGFINNNAANPNIEFLNGSSYFSRVTDARAKGLNANRNDGLYSNITYTYPSTLYRPGVSGHWMSTISSWDAYAPNSGGSIPSDEASRPFCRHLPLVASNFWQRKVLEQQTHGDMIPVASLGVLQCGGSNYKTTQNTIGTQVGVSIATSNTNFPAAFGCDANDYDNLPLLLLPDTAGSAGSAVLAYNETVNSNEVVVLQNGGALGTYAYGLEVQVPTDYNPTGSDTAKDRARLQLVLSKTSNASNNPQLFRSFRNGTNTTPSANISTLSGISTDQANPTSTTITLPHGNGKINSVFLFLIFTTSTTNVTEKLYIHDAYVELY